MNRASLKVFTAVVIIAATLSLFQNCAQPAPQTDDQKSTSTTSDPNFTINFSPASPLVGETVTIFPAGGSPPYTHTLISGNGVFSGNFFVPGSAGFVEIQSKDSKDRAVISSFQVTAATGGIDLTNNASWTVPVGVTSITVRAWGAGGGGGGADDAKAGGTGGGGAYSSRIIPVTAGQVFQIIVGVGGMAGLSDRSGTGAGAGGGAGSGGAPGGVSGTSGDSGSGGGGGGGTFLISSGSVYVAAGGGGGGGGAGIRSATALGAGGGGGVNGASGGVAGGATGATATSGGEQGGSVSGDGGGGGGGGGGLRGGRGGLPGGGDVTGGGGGGGSSFPAGAFVNGSGRNPGNASDPLRAGAGLGGTAAGNGSDGRILITW